MVNWNVEDIIPSDPYDLLAAKDCASPNEIGSVRYGDTFYIIKPPFYMITSKGKVTNKFQKFRLTKAEPR